MLKKNRLRKPTRLAVHADPLGDVAGDLAVDAWSQIRRCHRCFLTVEANGERVLACPGCRAHFAPYFFADLTPEALAEARFVFKSKPASLVLSTAKRYRPIVGISWWWNESNSPSGEPVMPRA